MPPACGAQVLVAGGAIVAFTWEENRGSSGAEGGSLARQFYSAAQTIAKGASPGSALFAGPLQMSE